MCEVVVVYFYRYVTVFPYHGKHQTLSRDQVTPRTSLRLELNKERQWARLGERETLAAERLKSGAGK